MVEGRRKSLSIFRKEALDYASSPDHLDHLIRITSPYAWLILVSIIFLLMATVAWGFFGSIPTRVSGDGILLAEKGHVYSAMSTKASCYVNNITVHPGQEVAEDQIIAELECPELASQLENTETYMGELTEEYAELLARSQEEIKIRKQHLTRQNKILEGIIVAERENLVEIEALLEVRRRSFEKGLTSRQEIVSSLRDYYASKREIDRTTEQLTQNKISEAMFMDQWYERLRELEMRLESQEHELNNLRDGLALSQEVRSPADGIVIMIQKSIGDLLGDGAPVVSIASTGQGLDAVLYVPADQGKRIQVGAKALISPSAIKREEYGSIIGEVVAVSEFPTTAHGMMAVLQNQELVKRFAEKGTLIAVRVRLNEDLNTYSQLEWSSSKGPEQHVTPGTLVTGMLTVREQAPITLIVPTFKKLLGGGG